MRQRVGTSVVVVWVCVCLATALAQSFGRLTGTVADAGGGLLPGVTVAISGPASRLAVTDAHGVYRFEQLLPGQYRVTASLAGFTAAAADVEVVAGGTALWRAVLAISSLQETVTVTGESPGINLSTSEHRRRRDRHASRERYAKVAEQPFRRVRDVPLSTFSIDVDTAAYANVRRFLSEGQLPPVDAVRVEELVNYFHYDYPAPGPDAPVAITSDVSACPWNDAHQLVLIGLRGRPLPVTAPPARNLVFLIDVSGSMAEPDKLPLVQSALRLLADTLTSDDRVSIVVYAGASGLVLPPTSGADRRAIHTAIDRLQAGGSTNGGEGITLAYATAREHFRPGAVNRVILATDGDFNVGLTSESALTQLIERERESGVFLSVLGVGTGNLQDATMEMLADKGNGNYAYLDSLQEARRVLVKEAGGTLVTVAKDVKIQVEFNPRLVQSYRLIGYENRLLETEDFANDRKDAGELGAGHSVTALYEIVPAGAADDSAVPLKYQAARPTAAAATTEIATIKLRYKAPDAWRSRLLATVVDGRPREVGPNLGFASAVAEFGLLLRESPHAPAASFAAAAARAQRYRGGDDDGYRAEFIRLVEIAGGLKRLQSAADKAR